MISDYLAVFLHGLASYIHVVRLAEWCCFCSQVGWMDLSDRQPGMLMRRAALQYYGIWGLPPYFHLIPWEWYHPTRSVCWHEKPLLPLPSRVVRSLFSEKVAFMAPAWFLGAACAWSVYRSPPTNGRTATAGGQPLSWEVRKSQTGVTLGSENCQEVWTS